MTDQPSRVFTIGFSEATLHERIIAMTNQSPQQPQQPQKPEKKQDPLHKPDQHEREKDKKGQQEPTRSNTNKGC
jgi:hypothetical protein